MRAPDPRPRARRARRRRATVNAAEPATRAWCACRRGARASCCGAARRRSRCSPARALYLQALQHRLPAGEGRGALLARASSCRPRAAASSTATARRSRSRRRSKSIWASPADVELDARRSSASSPRCSAWTPRELDQQARRHDRASSSTSSARSRPKPRTRSTALRPAGHPPAARVPPLLPRRRGDGARGRLHRHRRQRARKASSSRTRRRSRASPAAAA